MQVYGCDPRLVLTSTTRENRALWTVIYLFYFTMQVTCTQKTQIMKSKKLSRLSVRTLICDRPSIAVIVLTRTKTTQIKHLNRDSFRRLMWTIRVVFVLLLANAYLYLHVNHWNRSRLMAEMTTHSHDRRLPITQWCAAAAAALRRSNLMVHVCTGWRRMHTRG